MDSPPEPASLAEADAFFETPLAPAIVARLETHRDALLSSPHNLTALSADGITRDLLVDALAAVPVLRDLEGPVIDVGTGGGIPGLPLAIALQQQRFVLLDSNAKKIGFIDAVISALGMPNAETRCARVEEAGRAADLREHFGVALAKAVAPVRVLVEWLAPLLRPEGRLVLWKGPAVDQEIADASAALKALGVAVERVVPYDLKGRERRVLVVIRRYGPLDARYPRRVGVATKKPL